MSVKITGDDIQVPGDIEVLGILTPARSRTTEIASETFVDWIPLTEFRVWDTGGQLLPAAGAADDLGLVHGTWGTEPIHLSANDLKGLGATTRYARVQRKLKDTYVSGAAVLVKILCGMQTTVADTSCTIDLDAYISDFDNTMTVVAVAESATSMNSLTFSEKTFTLTATNFTAITELDLRLAVACTDGGTGTAVEPTILGVGISQVCKGG